MDSGSASSGGTSEAAKPEAAATTATSPHPGCGCAASASASPSSSSSSLTVRVTPTTGGQFDLQASKTDTVETLKKLISKKLKVPKERICLLHRDRQLREGTLQENQLVDGSRLTLLPSVETGLLAQRPEQSVMQALESLNDSQVNDFLSGKAPLNLTMRLGDHMMLIQLQLSTVTPSGGRRSGATPSTSGAGGASRVAGAAAASASASGAPVPATSRHAHAPATTSTTTAAASKPSTSLSTAPATASAPEICRCDSSSPASGSAASAAAAARPTLDTRALAEASRNLTQTLKQLSSEDNARARRQGAIIESMHHHGKGVYSGTFSGTLNPALQDRFGRPKRDISTIIHILNDLLCATPQYRRHASRTQQQQQQQQHHHHHQHHQHHHHHQQHQQHAAGSHSGSSAAVGSSSAVATATAASAAVPGKLVATANKAQHGATAQSLSDESASLSRENQATRGKMEHLRLIMEERRARRRARREARAAPYTTQWSAKSEQLAPQSGVEPMDTTTTAEQSAPSTTAAEVGPPEPVVA